MRVARSKYGLRWLAQAHTHTHTHMCATCVQIEAGKALQLTGAEVWVAVKQSTQ